MVGRSLVALLVWSAVAGCGDDTVSLVGDAADGPSGCPAANPCNPLGAAGQQWCPAGQRCGALILSPSAPQCPNILAIGCVPEGTQALGADCTWSAAGAEPGHDNCVSGAMCSSDRVCRDVCGFGGSPTEACAGGLSCVAIPGRFEPQGGGEAGYGVCAPPI